MKRVFLITILVAPLLLGGCSDKSGPTQAEVDRKPVTGVETAVVAVKNLPDSVEAAGTIKAATIGVVSSRVMGTVTAVLVREGQRVSKGEALLTIDDSDFAQKVKGAEAGLKEASLGLESARKQLELTETTYQRYSKLFESNAISRQEFDNMTLQRDRARLGLSAMEESVQRAKAGEQEAKVYKGFARVVAPFSGVVSGKKIEEGSMASPGMPLIVIEDDSSFVLEASFDGRFASLVKPGMTLSASVDNGKAYQARVTEVVPSMDAATRTFLVKASIKGEGLRSGLYANVSISVGQRPVLTVPFASIVEKGQLTGVYTVDENGVVSYSLVRTGRAYGGDVEVTTGLRPGERVITKGAEKAFDGGLIRAAK